MARYRWRSAVFFCFFFTSTGRLFVRFFLTAPQIHFARRLMHVILVFGAVISSVFETKVFCLWSNYALRYVGSVHEPLMVIFSQRFASS